VTLQRARCRTSLEILRESGSVSGRGNTPGRSLPQPCFVVCIRIVSCSLPKRIFLPPDSNSERSQRLLDTECSKKIRDILSEEVMRHQQSLTDAAIKNVQYNTTRLLASPQQPGSLRISAKFNLATRRCSLSWAFDSEGIGRISRWDSHTMLIGMKLRQHRLAIEIDKILPPETAWLRFRCWSPSRKMRWIGPPGCPRIAGQRKASCGQWSDYVRGRCKGEARTGRQYYKVHYLFILLLGLKPAYR